MSNVQKLLGLSILIAICVVSGVAYKSYNRQSKQPIIEQCTVSNPIGCDTLIEQESQTNKRHQEQMDQTHSRAEAYRAIKRLGTGGSEKLN